MPQEGTLLKVSDQRVKARRAVLLVALAIGVSTPVLAFALGAPTTVAQAQQIEFTKFDPDPLVLPPGGGVLLLRVEARASLADVSLTLVLEGPNGEVLRPATRHELAPRGPDLLAGDLEVSIPSNAAPGWWSIRVHEAFEHTDDGQRQVGAAGQTSVLALVHPDIQVAGREGASWPQTGGDASHSGRSLAVGPRSIDVVRWSFQPRDRQPFHTPVVGAAGEIYAVTWGGELYALDGDGRERWERAFPLASRVSFAPALSANGYVVVATDTGILYAIRSDRTLGWSAGLAEQGGAARPLAPPVVAPDGTILIVREPWTLERFAPDGARLGSIPLPAPDGGAPTIGPTPAPVEGPPVAVAPDGTAYVASGRGLAVLDATGEIIGTIDCECSPRGVSLVPDADVAFVAAGTEVVAVSRSTNQRLWSTSDEEPTRLSGTIWAPPTVGWAKGSGKVVYLLAEDGRLRMMTLDGSLVLVRNLELPARSQPLIDGDGNIYFADACRNLRSWAPLAMPRWIYEVDATGCNGLGAGLALTRSGGLLWPAPDGVLRMLGTNRLPVPGFTATWDHDAFLFDASSSYDPDGTPLTYVWDFGHGGSARGVSVRHRFADSGVHQVKLTVSDQTGTVSTTQEVHVNFPPMANIIDRSTDDEVILDASTSVDPEGNPLSYNWTLDGANAGTGAVLRFPGEPPHVYNVAVTVSDGERKARETTRALSPGRAEWRSVTLALYDGSCPSGICSFPTSLQLLEGDLVEVLVVNGASRSIQIDASLGVVTGGAKAAALSPGQQAHLHLVADRVGTAHLDVTVPDRPTAPTRLPVNVQPAPTEVSWRFNTSTETVRVGQVTEVLFHLEGPAPPADVVLRLVLREGVEEIASRRVSFDRGQPINATVALAFTPARTGALDLVAAVQTTAPGIATTTREAGTPETFSVDVRSPTLFQTLGAALTSSTFVSSFLVLLVVGALAVAGVFYVRSRRTGEATNGTAGSTAGAYTNGDATMVASLKSRKVDRFSIERTLGEGAFGRTYLANDTVLERRVVLKELEHVGPDSARELLLHEARTGANLSHANVVVVHDVVEESGRLLLVMEYIEGGTLTERMAKGPLELKAALNIMTDILHGLAALHEAGIVHRDLKPSNILITPDGVAKITDFGVAARTNGKGKLDEETFVGTPRYMAPEQLAGDRPGPQADLYAAGAILYEMLVGTHHLGVPPESTPDPGDLLQLRSNLPAPNVGKAMNQVLARALQRDAGARFQTAHDFLDVLRKGPA